MGQITHQERFNRKAAELGFEQKPLSIFMPEDGLKSVFTVPEKALEDPDWQKIENFVFGEQQALIVLDENKKALGGFVPSNIVYSLHMKLFCINSMDAHPVSHINSKRFDGSHIRELQKGENFILVRDTKPLLALVNNNFFEKNLTFRDGVKTKLQHIAFNDYKYSIINFKCIFDEKRFLHVLKNQKDSEFSHLSEWVFEGITRSDVKKMDNKQLRYLWQATNQMYKDQRLDVDGDTHRHATAEKYYNFQPNSVYADIVSDLKIDI